MPSLFVGVIILPVGLLVRPIKHGIQLTSNHFVSPLSITKLNLPIFTKNLSKFFVVNNRKHYVSSTLQNLQDLTCILFNSLGVQANFCTPQLLVLEPKMSLVSFDEAAIKNQPLVLELPLYFQKQLARILTVHWKPLNKIALHT